MPGDPAAPLYCVHFLDASVGIGAGNSAVGSQDIFRTTNGGITWTPVSGFPLGGSWYHQDYASATTGFMGCNGAIVRTTNAGATWQLQSGYPDCPIMSGMDLLNATTGLATGTLSSSESGVFKIVDGGAT
jgi:photosystem II stability/assembly factor-like uncharacterized protein